MSARFMLFRFPSRPSIYRNLRSLIFLAAPRGLACALLCVLFPSLFAQAPTPVPVLTWRYDLTHAGQNTKETALTPANVNPSSFGKLFSLPVNSTVYAQPLYVPNIKMSDGQVHNVLFVATENDSVYAFDADSNGGANSTPIWQISMLTAAHGAGAGATAIPYQDTSSPDVAPTVGITGTPAINLATNTMYLVANTKENGAYFSRLHAISIVTGAEQANSPVEIKGSAAGTGHGSVNGQITFSPLIENQRPALNFYNGFVYIGFAAHGDNGNWHGWLFAYNGSSLKQTAALCLSPNDVGAGVWGSGAGLPIDTSTGKMFVVTGNGARSKAPPFTASTDYGESVIAFDIANGQLTPTDEFTAFNYLLLNTHDLDQGSGGLLMLPDQPGANPHMLITAGKESRITVLNRDNLGGYATGASSNTNALQDLAPAPPISPVNCASSDPPTCTGFWSTAAYWNGNVYLWAEKNKPMLYKMNGGVLDTQPDSQGAVYSNFPDPVFTISANGQQDGIAWAVRADQFNSNGPAVLYAWEANDLSTPIYESDTNSKRDTAGKANKFSVPVVTNGKVYFACHGEVDVYGLLNGEPTAAAPVITPDGGSFAASQTVTMTSATPSADIYYTLNGTTPTPGSTLYSGPITINSDTTVKALASAAGYVQSSVTIATFQFTNQTPAVTFAPPAGTYVSAQTVSLHDTDASAKIYYTLDGSTPSASSTLYTAPINVKVSETFKAIAIDPSLKNSDISTGAYVIQAGGTSIDFSQGFSSTAGLTLNGSAVAINDTRLQLTTGETNQAGSVFWNVPINVQAFSTTFQFQLSNANGGNGITFTVQNVGPTALGGDSAGLGYQDIKKSVAVKFNFYNYQGEGSDSTGIYTNGEAPVLPTVDISPSGVQVGGGDAIQATITYDGATLFLTLVDHVTNDTFNWSTPIDIPTTVGANTAYVGFTGGTGGLTASQKLLTWIYTTQAVAPVFSPAAGTFSSAQNVTLSSKTAGAAIYYTTDGSAPSAASKAYSAPIAVSASETIKAIAISGALGTSQIASAAYNIQSGGGGNSKFALTGSPISISGSGAGTSTITVTPTGGFTGTVKLACSITHSPANATNLPTCTVTQPAAISGSQAVTAMLTVTTAEGTAAVDSHPLRGLGGVTALSALLLIWLPRRRRTWQTLLCILLFIGAVAGISACGSVSPKVTGTTPGNYAVTVTGTSGSLTASAAVTVTVQ